MKKHGIDDLPIASDFYDIQRFGLILHQPDISENPPVNMPVKQSMIP